MIDSNWEYNIIKRYYQGGKLVPEKYEGEIVRKNVSMGLMTCTKFARPGHPEKVFLTSRGKKMFRRERIRNNTLLRFLHGCVHGL